MREFGSDGTPALEHTNPAAIDQLLFNKVSRALSAGKIEDLN